jgi:hypothetical protein
LLTLSTMAPHLGGNLGIGEKPGGYGNRSRSYSSSRCSTLVCVDLVLEPPSSGSVWCNRTDQIIRAQVRKQAPKRSNFQT